MKRVIIFLCVLALHLNAYGETIVFEGYPEIKNQASPEGTTNEPVVGSKKDEFKLVITKDDGKYYWFSRGKKELIHNRSGAFDYFVEPNGAGIIKITQTEDGKYMYMEMLSIELNNLIYWGVGDEFQR